MRVVASDHAQRRLAGLILFRPHQVAAARRPRTEARPRRKDPRKWKHGIDKPRPVTEARIERSEMRGPPSGWRREAGQDLEPTQRGCPHREAAYSVPRLACARYPVDWPAPASE